MAGIISPSMPVFVVENKAARQPRVLQLQRGLGKVLRFGANGPEVIARLRTMAATCSRRRCARCSRAPAAIELKPLMAQALNMGDEVHNRNAAATALFFKRIAPALFDADVPRDDARSGARVHRRQRPLLPQPVDGRVQGDAATRRRGVAGSSMVDGDGAQRRQLRRAPVGHRRRAGSKRRPIRSTACTSPATRSPTPRPTSATRRSPRPPASAASRWPRRRRSSSSSAARRPMPCTTACACARSRSASIRRSRCRALDFAAAAAGIDARKVVDCGVLPVINSGIAHRAGRRRPDRRRRHHRADGVLHRRGEGAGAQHRRRREPRATRSVELAPLDGAARQEVPMTACSGRRRRQRADPRRPAHGARRPIRRRVRDRDARRRP